MQEYILYLDFTDTKPKCEKTIFGKSFDKQKLIEIAKQEIKREYSLDDEQLDSIIVNKKDDTIIVENFDHFFFIEELENFDKPK